MNSSGPSPSLPGCSSRSAPCLRTLHYNYRTANVYVDGIRRYIPFHSKRHPRDMGKAEVEAFLTHLATACPVSASPQNQTLSALLFLYENVLEIEVDGVECVPALGGRTAQNTLARGDAGRPCGPGAASRVGSQPPAAVAGSGGVSAGFQLASGL